MANTLTAVTPKLLAMGLEALRENAIMPRVVNRRYEELAGEQGSTIDVPIPSAISAQAVAPGATPPSTADVAPTSVAVAMDQWQEAPFYMTDQDLLTVMQGTIPMQASEAIKSLANVIDQSILDEHTKFFGYHGRSVSSVWDTPFNDGKVNDVTQARKVLNNQLAPMNDRWFVMDPDAEASALQLRAFHDMSFHGSSASIREGDIDRRFGFAFAMDQNVRTFTPGSVTGTINVTGAEAVGSKSIGLTTGVGEAIAIVAGDIVTFSNHSQSYVATAALTVGASSAGDLLIEPGLTTALTSSETITVVGATEGARTENLAIHRDAIAFVTRPLVSHGSDLGVISSSVIDPISGLTLRLEITHEHKRIRFSYDVLWGVQTIRRELGCRVFG